MKLLLALKAEFKQKSGQEYKPGNPPKSVFPSSTPSVAAASLLPSVSPSPVDSKTLYDKVAEQGDVVRRLKSKKASKV